jgi:hypothetical protein
MTEDMSFGDWSCFTPETIKTYSEAKLLYAMQLNRGGVYDAWARAEIQRRQSTEISTLLAALETATKQVHQETVILARISENSALEVRRLVVSSLTIEKLTKWLVGLTVVLGILTLVLVVDVGIKFHHEYLAPLPPPTAPQTPTHPPR